MEHLQEAFEEALGFAQGFAVSYTPAPAVALLAGSRAKGASKPNSDYDIVFLYDSLPSGAWREMVAFRNEVVELFAHDLSTLRYFFQNIERPSGKAGLACMIDQGIPVLGAKEKVGRSAQELAREFLASGPIQLDGTALSQRRYALTDLAEALSGNLLSEKRLAIGSALYNAFADFILLANGHWTAVGKAIPAALRGFDPELERSFTNAFEQLYWDRSDALLQSLVTEILHPFGGRLRAGFRQEAPSSWRQ